MLASKENARKALKQLLDFEDLSQANYQRLLVIEQFLEAAIKRLPTEESFKRDRERRRAKAVAK